MATFIMSWLVTIPGEAGQALDDAQALAAQFVSEATDHVEAIAQNTQQFEDVGAFGGTIAMTSNLTVDHSVW